MLKIIVDGSADMPEGWAELYQFDILPIPIQIGERTYYEGEDITPDEFYRLVKDGDVHPQTAAPSPDKIMSFIENICELGDLVLSINVSGDMSSTVTMVKRAANALKDKINVYPFDSKAGSAVLAFMAREARLRERAGETIAEIQASLEAMKEQVMVVLTLDSLDFAYRSGRVGALQTLITSLLKIKPVISLQDGLLSVSDKVRTRKKSLEYLVTKIKDRFGMQPIRVAIVHSQDLETANILNDMTNEVLNVVETIFTELAISVAANLGPKTVGIVAIPEKI
ncbi:MAG: DegV family protein [Chloroflexota bacterium]|nr:DegV family protein [Chloroflexota bacterium]